MEIVNGVLKLHFKWDTTGQGTLIQYVVRYQSNDFYLIGATCTYGYHADTKIPTLIFQQRDIPMMKRMMKPVLAENILKLTKRENCQPIRSKNSSI